MPTDTLSCCWQWPSTEQDSVYRRAPDEGQTVTTECNGHDKETGAEKAPEEPGDSAPEPAAERVPHISLQDWLTMHMAPFVSWRIDLSQAASVATQHCQMHLTTPLGPLLGPAITLANGR